MTHDINVPRPVRLSQSEMTEIVLPNDTNILGNILGGKVMHLVDLCAAVAAHRHCGSVAVTASIDHMDFRFPIRVGELVILQSSVNRAFQTSMEVGVKVYSEDMLSAERRHTSSAYLTFVALDENGRRHRIPPVLPETEQEQRRYADAALRRAYRLEQRMRRAAG